MPKTRDTEGPLLSTADVVELTAISLGTLKDWTDAGVLRPVSGGMGRGHHRRYSFMQALAVGHARLWVTCNASRELIAGVLNYLGNMTEAQLLAEFKAGRVLMMVTPGEPPRLIAPREDEPWESWLLNIERLYQKYIVDIQKITPKKNAKGRSRGLARAD